MVAPPLPDPGVLDLEQSTGHSPSLVLLSHEVRCRDDHVCEELFAELRSAVDLFDAPDLETGRLQVDDQDRDAFVLRNVPAAFVRGAAEVRKVGSCTPGLLPLTT